MLFMKKPFIFFKYYKKHNLFEKRFKKPKPFKITPGQIPVTPNPEKNL